MDLGLKGKVALVTGGTRGIGRAIVDSFLKEGARVAFCARSEVELASATASFEAAGASVWGSQADLSDGSSIGKFVAGAAERLGGIDIAVSNVSALVLTDDEAAWRRAFEVDMLGSIRLFEAARPHLKDAAAGSGDAAFTVISSIVAAEPYKPSAYSAMKAALINYAKGVARAHALSRIRCNVVSPGNVFFEGGVWHRMKEEKPEFYQAWLDKNPTGRMASAQEVADAAVFLSSPRSGFTTGANLVVDGCLTQRASY